jgi:selenophosphate synthetase-related protein
MDVFTIKALLSSGMYSDYASESYTEALQQTFDLPPYLTRTKPITKAVSDFHKKWNINPDDTLYDVRQDRVVFPVHHGGILVDAVGRALDNRTPKWLRYGSSPVPFVHPCTPRTIFGRVGVVVEDAISAYVLHELTGAYGIALLGTQLTAFHKWYLTQYFDSVIVALDPDALDKTMSIVKELRASISDVRGMKITDDLKYGNEEDIDKLKEMINAS